MKYISVGGGILEGKGSHLSRGSACEGSPANSALNKALLARPGCNSAASLYTKWLTTLQKNTKYINDK